MEENVDASRRHGKKEHINEPINVNKITHIKP